MGSVNVNIPQIRKQAKTLRDLASQLDKGTVKVIREANEALKSSWNSKASQTFIKHTDEMNTKIQANVKALQDAASFLDQACNTLAKADQEVNAKIR